MIKNIIISIILISNVCFAKVYGHIKPLPEELLNNPVTLDCGAVIVENVEIVNGKPNNKEITNKDIKKLNNICSSVSIEYDTFLIQNNIFFVKTNNFYWEVSFIPDTNNYRCLNDTEYRFNSRVIEEGSVSVDGYTDLNNRHTFSTSNRNSKFFKTVFAHELFHAMNMFYGVKDNEDMAEVFTEKLGYGR